MGTVLAVIAALVLLEERARWFDFATETRPALESVDRVSLARAAQEVLDRAHATMGFGGCALVALGGEIVFERCYGPGHGEPPAADARFSIGSLWKAMVGLLVHRAVRAGRARLDDPIVRHIPELAGAPCAHATLGQLLAHTSGLPYTIRLATNLRLQLTDARRSDADFLAEIAGYDLEFTPGGRFLYSNPGYGLLAIAVGRWANRPWPEVLERLFAEAGMNDTGFLGPRAGEVRGHLPLRCAVVAGRPCMLTLPQWNYSLLPGGGEFSTVRDLLAWDRALDRWQKDDPATMNDYLTPGPFEGYASGWGIERRVTPNGGEVLVQAHSGEDPGHHSFIARIPEKDAFVVVLSNTDFTLAHARFTLFTALVDAIVGRSYEVVR